MIQPHSIAERLIRKFNRRTLICYTPSKWFPNLGSIVIKFYEINVRLHLMPLHKRSAIFFFLMAWSNLCGPICELFVPSFISLCLSPSLLLSGMPDSDDQVPASTPSSRSSNVNIANQIKDIKSALRSSIDKPPDFIDFRGGFEWGKRGLVWSPPRSRYDEFV